MSKEELFKGCTYPHSTGCDRIYCEEVESYKNNEINKFKESINEYIREEINKEEVYHDNHLEETREDENKRMYSNGYISGLKMIEYRLNNGEFENQKIDCKNPLNHPGKCSCEIIEL